MKTKSAYEKLINNIERHLRGIDASNLTEAEANILELINRFRGIPVKRLPEAERRNSDLIMGKS